MSFIDPTITSITRRIETAHPNVVIDDDYLLGLQDWRCPVSIDLNMPYSGYGGGEQIANVFAIIIPLPHSILLNAKQAEQKATLLIRYLHWLHKEKLPKDLVLRTYAIPSNNYKRIINMSGKNDFVKHLYRGKPMPKWIWVTEISSKSSYNSTDPSKWLINGEILIDASSNPLSPDFIAIH